MALCIESCVGRHPLPTLQGLLRESSEYKRSGHGCVNARWASQRAYLQLGQASICKHASKQLTFRPASFLQKGFEEDGLDCLSFSSERDKVRGSRKKGPGKTLDQKSIYECRGKETLCRTTSSSSTTQEQATNPLPLSISRPPNPLNSATPLNIAKPTHLPKPPRISTRRSLLATGALLLSSSMLLRNPEVSQAGSIVLSRAPPPEALELLDQASEAWGRGLDPTNQNRWTALAEACTLFDRLVALEPERTEWKEARGQLRVDSKKFNEALDDFNLVLEKDSSNFRGYSSRALAYEGLAYWDKAVDDYTTALQLGKKATGFDEPYVLNSRGNALASLGSWSEALRDYELSVKGFQEGRQLDGAIYSAANAALMQIQLGNEKEGLKELTTVARRAPGSIDMRAALAALYWSQGREREAESTWQFACENINAGQLYDGCAKYRDQDWLRRIRRWPPVMADRMQDFFQLKHKS